MGGESGRERTHMERIEGQEKQTRRQTRNDSTQRNAKGPRVRMIQHNETERRERTRERERKNNPKRDKTIACFFCWFDSVRFDANFFSFFFFIIIMVIAVNRWDQNAFLHMKEFDETERGDEARRGRKKEREEEGGGTRREREGEANKQRRHIR